MFAAAESKTTSTEPRSRRNRSGLTLTEVLISMGLASLVASALLVLSVSTGRSLAELFNYVDLDHMNRIALDSLTRELRQVTYLTSISSNTLSFVDKDGAALSYVYSPTDRYLQRLKAGEPDKTLLTECDQLSFAIYQRTPVSNLFDLIPVSDLTNCKVVCITWSCSRKMFGLTKNTEQGQTAKVVIRNKKEL
jgi:hypothetical protein